MKLMCEAHRKGVLGCPRAEEHGEKSIPIVPCPSRASDRSDSTPGGGAPSQATNDSENERHVSREIFEPSQDKQPSEHLPAGIKMTSRELLHSFITFAPPSPIQPIVNPSMSEVLVRPSNGKRMDGIRTSHPGSVTLLERQFFDTPGRRSAASVGPHRYKF